jgi:hypothetical protein
MVNIDDIAAEQQPNAKKKEERERGERSINNVALTFFCAFAGALL